MLRLTGLLAQNDAALADLHEQVDKFDALTEPGAPPPLNRLVAEFGLRSFETSPRLGLLDHITEDIAAADEQLTRSGHGFLYGVHRDHDL